MKGTGRLLAMGYVLFFFLVLVRDLRSLVDFVDVALPLLTLNSLEVRFLAPPFEWGAALLLFLALRPVSAPPSPQQEAAPM